jgi:hypothetical protein
VRLRDGRWREAYVEFGDETTNISVACETGGGRIILDKFEQRTRLRPDPNGKRPLRDSRGIVWKTP